MSTTIKAEYVQDNEFADLIANNQLVVVDYTAASPHQRAV